MARRNYTDIHENVKHRLGNRSDVTDALVESWINDALLAIAMEFVHPEYEGRGDMILSAGTDELDPIAYVSDLWWPVLLQNLTTGSPLRPDDKENIERHTSKPIGTPYRFYWWNKKFYFDVRGNTDTTIRVWYIIKPERFNDGESPLEEQYDTLIEIYAMRNGMNHLRNFRESQLCDVQGNNYIAMHKLPVREARKNDYLAGIRVRRR